VQTVVLLAALGFIARGAAECANACNGHGKCSSYDMCICNRNWQANDCSERTCLFGLAHVDTPKGDLDMSGTVTGPTTMVAENSAAYPFGTTEMFPQVEDSDHRLLSNSAHYYMECSNKGTCQRTTGACVCYEGYEGVACQRASCPGTPVPCSGNGVCRSILQLATAYYGNTYSLWDKSSTMGCLCDAGFHGPDCSLRSCKHGVDPLYLDDSATVKYSVFNVAQFTNIPGMSSSTDSVASMFNDGTPLAGTGYWALRFFDVHGEDWLTRAIPIDATCAQVVDALQQLPNNVVPVGSVQCTKVAAIGASEQSGFSTVVPRGPYDKTGPYDKSGNVTGHGKNDYSMIFKMALWDMQLPSNAVETDTSSLQVNKKLYSSGSTTDASTISGVIYRLHFNGNPGALREPEIEIYLDGKRPSLASSSLRTGTSGKTSTKVWTDGQQGESKDYFGDHCNGVTVQVASGIPTVTSMTETVYYLTGFTPAEKALLKACLGDSDMHPYNNVEVYNWDYGSATYPHIVKLVRTVSTFMDGGYYVVLWYDTNLCGTPAGGGATNSYLCDNLGSTLSGYNAVGLFRLLHPFLPPDHEYLNILNPNEHDSWEVYTTKGTLAQTSSQVQAVFSYGSKYIYTVNPAYDTALTDDGHDGGKRNGDLSCEIAVNASHVSSYVWHCMNVSDIFTLLAWDEDSLGTNTNPNPRYINLYTANRIYTTSSKNLASYVDSQNAQLGSSTQSVASQYMTHVIESDLSTNWAASVLDQQTPPPFKFSVYKFIPSADSTYTYVAECANRGLCDTTTGNCKCFAGYTSDSCSEQSSLSL